MFIYYLLSAPKHIQIHYGYYKYCHISIPPIYNEFKTNETV